MRKRCTTRAAPIKPWTPPEQFTAPTAAMVAAAEKVDVEAERAPDHPSIVLLNARTAELEASAELASGTASIAAAAAMDAADAQMLEMLGRLGSVVPEMNCARQSQQMLDNAGRGAAEMIGGGRVMGAELGEKLCEQMIARMRLLAMAQQAPQQRVKRVPDTPQKFQHPQRWNEDTHGKQKALWAKQTMPLGTGRKAGSSTKAHPLLKVLGAALQKQRAGGWSACSIAAWGDADRSGGGSVPAASQQQVDDFLAGKPVTPRTLNAMAHWQAGAPADAGCVRRR